MTTNNTSAKFKVVVTGFGLFRNYASNPSWEAVKLLQFSDCDVELVKIKIPVAYDCVEKETDRIWKEYNPTLVVHCGVSHLAKGITLEKRAVKNIERYCQADVNSCLPRNSPIKPCDCKNLEFIKTTIDVDRICDQVNQLRQNGKLKISACVSDRAGEYLCEYIYRCSLQKNPQRTLFVHVPQVSDTVNIEDIAAGLEVTIKSVLEQLKAM